MPLADQAATSSGDSVEPVPRASSHETRVPGEAGFWILVLGDLTAFALLFCVFVYYRGQDAGHYLDSQLRLNRAFGALNVVLLLTSSWCVVQGVEAFRERVTLRARRCFGAGLLFGAGFVAVKVLEYGEKIRDGIVRNISVGYIRHKIEKIEKNGETPLWRVVDWEPHEISAVPIPADAGSQFRAAPVGERPALYPCSIAGLSAAAAARVRMQMSERRLTGIA